MGWTALLLLRKTDRLPGARARVEEECSMLPTDASLAHLSQVISHATAPTFLLGAVAAFIAVLVGRMNNIIERSRAINAIPDKDPIRGHLKADLPRLRRRARL